jgi:hypothetical protein
MLSCFDDVSSSSLCARVGSLFPFCMFVNSCMVASFILKQGKILF